MTEMKISEVLDKAADLIEPEGKWLQYQGAATKNGDWTVWSNDDAECFCASTAIARIDQGCSLAAYHYVTGLLGDIPNWNDAPERTQPEVVAKLREIAAQARAESK